jgi:hypothetical protein|tara:strand:- start:11933 stop:12154 length:222 start_codon:yes stop_codon:yes gene_type:complete
MAWKCITEDCSVRFFSISDVISGLHDRVYEFIFAIHPSLLAIVLLLSIGLAIVLMMVSVSRAIKAHAGDNNPK